MTEEHFPITKQELSLIKNNCFHPETDSCDGCEFACDDEKANPCSWIGANGLEEEILSRPTLERPQCGTYPRCTEDCDLFWGCSHKAKHDERERVLNKLVAFRMISNVKIEDESPGNYYTSLDAWKEFELLLEELRQKDE
jgi:hypothetical protein